MAAILQHDFNIASGVNLNTVAPQVGSTMVKHSVSTTDMVGNTSGTGVGVAASQSACYYCPDDPGSDNYKVAVYRDSAPSGNYEAVACVAASADTRYRAIWSSSGQTITLYRRLNGSQTAMGSASSGHTPGSIQAIGIEVDLGNSRVRVYKIDASLAEVEVIPWQTDAAPLARGFAGIGLYNTATATNAGATSILAESVSGAATAVTISGPASGTVNVASANFTAGFNGTPPGSSVTVTPASDLAGTFSPTTVAIGGTDPATATFTFTPTVTGAHSITLSNNGGLANPAASAYQSNAAPTVKHIRVNLTPIPGQSSIPDATGVKYAFKAVGSWNTGDLVTGAYVGNGSDGTVTSGLFDCAPAGLSLTAGVGVAKGIIEFADGSLGTRAVLADVVDV